MKQLTFSIRRFKNRTGAYSWRVDGRLNGLRIRRNFKTQEEAAAEKASLEIQALQLDAGMQSVSTWLTPEQVRDAETAFRRISNHGKPLTFFVDFAVTNFREATGLTPLKEATTAFVAFKEHEFKQDLISEPYLSRLRREINLLLKRCPVETIGELTSTRLLAYFESGMASRKTYNNRRGIASAFLKFALRRELIAENPLVKIPAHRIRRRRGGAETLTPERAAKMMEFVEREIPAAVPFFALCLFAGVRPCLRGGEILRLKPEHVRLSEGFIRIGGEVSKVREPRRTTIQPNLAAWLKAYPLTEMPIVPPNLQHLRERVVKKFDLGHDVMRHTFISMFVAKFRSIGEAALQAGNSEEIIRKSYLDLKTLEEAERFFGILPKRRYVPDSDSASNLARAA